MSEVGIPVGGYPKEIFTNGFDSKIVCNSCNQILRDPVQSYCGHRFCRACITSVVSTGEQVRCQSCIEEGLDNEDYSIIRKDSLFPDNALRREMFSMEAKCINTGCSWVGKFRAYESHMKECKYRPVICPQCNCPVDVNKVKNHMDNECPKRKTKCKHCHLETTQDQIESHTRECPKVPVKCEACGKKKISRDMLKHHQETECANQKLTCSAGCDPIERHRFISHIEQKVGFHIQSLMMTQETLSDKMKSIVSQEQISQMNERIEGLRTAIQTTEQLSGQLSRTSESPTQLQNSSDRSFDNRCKALEVKVSTFEAIATTLHREIERCLDTNDKSRVECAKHTKKMEDSEKKIQELEKKLASREVQIAELNQRLLQTELSTFNGELLWRVDNWSQVRNQACSGTNVSIFSVPFYTDKYGYKMCVRLYPNGDGMGKGSHLSIFFVIMKGNFDAVLTWPFCRRVTFLLIDQAGSHHIKDSFRTDPQSSSFKKPTSDMNIASGCPLFIPLERLQNSGFVKDNVLFIRTKVEQI